MNCIYCQEECPIDSEAKKAPTGWYHCKPCGTSYYVIFSLFGVIIETVDVWTTINNRKYLARLKPYVSATLILQCEPADIGEGNYFHHTLFNFNNLMPITPQNVHDKIQTILVFS
jgi:hypothetical protein